MAPKKEAQLQEQNFKISYDDLDDITFSEVYNHYIEYKKKKLQPSSIYNINKLVVKHMLPYFCTKSIFKITSRDIINWQNIIDKLKMDNGNFYSIKYKTEMHTYLHAVFLHATNTLVLIVTPVWQGR